MRKVNDGVIYKNKYYPIYYTDKLEINLVPISYYSRQQAIFTLEKQFGRKCWKTMKIIKGARAIKLGIPLGKNSFRINGKSYQVKKYYIPPEHNYNRSTRRLYMKRVTGITQDKKIRTKKRNILDYYFKKTYGA